MDFPASLPWMLEYRTGSVVMTTLCRRPVRFISTSGDTDAKIVTPQIPVGCDGWRRIGETEWHPLSDIPEEWMPFLQRERGTALDPRPKVEVPDGRKLWEEMYRRSLLGRSRTFRQAFALFCKENGYWPARSWPLMPTEEKDEYRLVKDVPREELTQ